MAVLRPILRTYFALGHRDGFRLNHRVDQAHRNFCADGPSEKAGLANSLLDEYRPFFRPIFPSGRPLASLTLARHGGNRAEVFFGLGIRPFGPNLTETADKAIMFRR